LLRALIPPCEGDSPPQASLQARSPPAVQEVLAKNAVLENTETNRRRKAAASQEENVMKAITRYLWIAGLGVVVTIGSGAVAQADEAKVSLPAAAPLQSGPGTFWNLLGIPQGSQAIRDARLNRLGNHPNRERVPPLKRIADPSNLESKNPAIATAAKIKKDQDLAPQKIKAIKYLGTIACCCPTNKDDVKNALLAALDDCTDEVRQAAAEAICHAAGNPCSICNDCSCCAADVMNKLSQMANGQDEKGCWKEPYCAVRQAASLALEACRSVRNPSPAEVAPPQREEPKERRVPAAPKVPTEDPGYSTPKAQSGNPAPGKDAPKPPAKPATKSAEGQPAEGDGWKVRQASDEEASVGFAVATDSGDKPAVAPQATAEPVGEPRKLEAPAAKPAQKPAETSAKPMTKTGPEPKPQASAKSVDDSKVQITFYAAE